MVGRDHRIRSCHEPAMAVRVCRFRLRRRHHRPRATCRGLHLDCTKQNALESLRARREDGVEDVQPIVSTPGTDLPRAPRILSEVPAEDRRNVRKNVGVPRSDQARRHERRPPCRGIVDVRRPPPQHEPSPGRHRRCEGARNTLRFVRDGAEYRRWREDLPGAELHCDTSALATLLLVVHAPTVRRTRRSSMG